MDKLALKATSVGMMSSLKIYFKNKLKLLKMHNKGNTWTLSQEGIFFKKNIFVYAMPLSTMHICY